MTAATGVLVVAGDTTQHVKTAEQDSALKVPEVQAVGPAVCGDVLRDVVGRLGQGTRSNPKSTSTAQVRAIADEVERIRNIKFTKPIPPTFVTQEELARRVASSVEEDYGKESADKDTRVLVALGAIPPTSNTADLLEEALSEGVIGFYEPDTKRILVGTNDPGVLLTPLARITLAHELTHALTDQILGLPDIVAGSDERQEDAALSALALIEGDATLVMQIYAFTSLTLEEQQKLIEDPAIPGADIESERIPSYLQRALEFPYLTGLGFACDTYSRGGGWAAVDSAYGNPPKTSAQVMFPDRYRAAEGAVDAPDPGPPGEGWTEAATYAVGASDLLWLFGAPGGEDTESLSRPAARASEWAGGELRLWTRQADSAVGVSLAQRSERGSLCASVRDWYRRSFPKDRKVSTAQGEALAADGRSQDAVLRCPGALVRLGIAPNIQTARSLVQ